jgi:RNA polymerase sigma factor (sigma-70 family)
MARSVPKELLDLFAAGDPSAAEEAWERFLRRFSETILNAAWCSAAEYDGRMDRYAYILEQLKRDGFRRLRGYGVDPRARFQTWLTVVCRRLCVDYHRERYGRERGAGRDGREPPDTSRRRLVDLVVEELDPDGIRDESSRSPEEEVRLTELTRALERALSGLDPEDRLLLRLRFQDGLPARDVARVMHLPTVFHFYRRLNPILTSLRLHLTEKGIEGSEP